MATGGGNQWNVFSECVNSIILKYSFLLFSLKIVIVRRVMEYHCQAYLTEC